MVAKKPKPPETESAPPTRPGTQVVPTPSPTGGPPGPPGECLRRLILDVDNLLGRPAGGVSLLDRRLAAREKPAASLFDPREWNAAILQVLTSGVALDAVIAETPQAGPARHGLYAVLDALRYDEVDDLRALPQAWPRIRDGLRQIVLGLVRVERPDDVLLLDRALGACGIAPLSQPETRPLGAALRQVLQALMNDDHAEAAGRELQRLLRHVTGRVGFARQARFHLARGLAERGPLLEQETARGLTPDRLAYLADPDPSRSPRLPAPLVGAALLLLAGLDADEARVAGAVGWGGQSAYNVLRNVAAEARWSGELRRAMDELLDAIQVDAGALAQRAARLAGIDRAVPPAAIAPKPAGAVIALTPPSPAGPPARVLLSQTEEQVYEFLARAFQEKRRPTYDDAQAEGWTRTTYSSALKSLEAHGLLERKRGRPVRVFRRDAAR